MLMLIGLLVFFMVPDLPFLVILKISPSHCDYKLGSLGMPSILHFYLNPVKRQAGNDLPSLSAQLAISSVSLLSENSNLWPFSLL